VAYSILNRGIERDVLPLAQRYGMGTLVWGPLGQGMLTGRIRRGEQTDLIRASFFKAFSDAHRLDAVEQLIPLAEEAGLPMTHLAMAFAIAHPGVTSALLGPRTMNHRDAHTIRAPGRLTSSRAVLGARRDRRPCSERRGPLAWIDGHHDDASRAWAAGIAPGARGRAPGVAAYGVVVESVNVSVLA
jgi:hypothetical protein